MFDDPAAGLVFRPPSEARSVILRATIGCAHNACTFCGMYRQVPFRVRPLEEVAALVRQAARCCPLARRVFLADGNALVLPTEHLLTIMGMLHRAFPKLARVTCYGGPQDILRKSPAELAALRQAGLRIIYLGVESGDDAVLAAVHKGATAAEMTTAGQRVLAAGIALSVMVILGLGGVPLSRQHAVNTGRVISAINPTMFSVLTLMLPEGTPLRAAADRGEFQPLSPHGLMRELHEMISHTVVTAPCLLRSNHVSNLLPLAGTLPRDKGKLLADIAAGLAYFKDQDEPTYNEHGEF